MDEANDSIMKKEADSFITQMSPDLQPRQRDAILAAISGNTQELEAVRNARNGKPSYPQDIKVTVPAENMRLYTHTGNPSHNKPLLVYLHGGGWTIGGLNSCARFCGEV